ncbi:unnamed protein product, partial [Bubo scandiacus]
MALAHRLLLLLLLLLVALHARAARAAQWRVRGAVGDASRNLGAAAGSARAGKRPKGRARLECLLRRPDSVPSGVGAGPGAGRVGGGWLCPLQGRFLSVSLKAATGQAAALPPVLSSWPPEFCLEGQPVPKGGRRPPLSTVAPRQPPDSGWTPAAAPRTRTARPASPAAPRAGPNAHNGWRYLDAQRARPPPQSPSPSRPPPPAPTC